MNRDFNLFSNIYRGRTFHFCGIGGVSMSGLAAILQKNGYKVQGSDTAPGHNLYELISSGVRVFSNQSKGNLEGADIFIRSLAIREDNEEYAAAVKKGMPIISRHELLGEILENFRYSVAVSGTHGKTTVSSMIGYILRLAKLDPSLNIGGDLFYEKHGTCISDSEYFVAEACEYGNSFHHFKPYIGVVLNIEADHLDFFKDIDDVKEGFLGFTRGIKEGGIAVYCSDDANASWAAINSGRRAVSFGSSEKCDYSARNITCRETGSVFSIYKNGGLFGNFRINIPGMHNVINALCAAAVCDLLDADIHFIKHGLLAFKGAGRRLEHLCTTKDGIRIYDDYAHHPTEIKASLKALSEIAGGRLICVFQPHTYTRLKALFDDFLHSFDDCDVLVLMPIYAAREKNIYGISSADLLEKLSHPCAVCIDSFAGAREYVKKIARTGDLVVSMGAGDVYKVTYPMAGRK